MRLMGFDARLLDAADARAALERAREPSATEEEARELACRILGLASPEEVPRVDGALFRALILRTHPDKQGSTAGGDGGDEDESLFLRVKAAYDQWRQQHGDAAAA